MRVLGTTGKKMSGRLPYFFLTIYFGSLGILLTSVLFIYLITYINTETLHIISMVLQKGVSWCSDTLTYLDI